MNENVDLFFGEFMRKRNRRRTIVNRGRKLKPNEKCPCGSGIKYKKCCKYRLEETARQNNDYNITMKADR